VEQRTLALCLSGILILAIGNAQASILDVRAVVEYGDPAPGTGEAFIAFARPAINDAGRVAFEGSIPNSGRIWRETAGGLEQVAAWGNAPAGAPPGATIFGFRELLFSDNGHVVVWAELDNGDEGYFAASPAGVATIVLEDQVAPGTTDTFSRIDSAMRISDGGEIAFYGVLQTFTDPTGIWMGGAGTLSLLARQGQVAPGGGGETFFIMSDFPRISAAGNVGFASLLFGLSANAGLWTGTPGSLANPLVNPLSDYRYAFFSDNEEWTFVDQSPPAAPRILAGVPGDFRTVYTLGDPAPGLPAGAGIGIFPYRPDLRMNRSRQVAFQASTDEASAREGLWSEGSGTLELLALQGEVAPGTGGLTYDEIEGFAINDLGQTAFLASFEGLGGRGLFVAHPGQAVELVVRDGGTFEVAPGDVRAISWFDAGLESGEFLRQHPRGVFNNSGELALGLGFGFASSGVYVITVPELRAPLGALVALACVAGVSMSRSRSAGREPAP